MRASLQSLGDSQGAMENYYLGQAATGQDESPDELLVLLSEVTPERILRRGAERQTRHRLLPEGEGELT